MYIFVWQISYPLEMVLVGVYISCQKYGSENSWFSPLYRFSLFKNGNIQQNRQVHFQSRLIDQCSQIFKMHKSKAALAFQNGFHTFFEQNQFPKICARLSLFLSLSLSLSMSHLLYIFTKLS